MKTLQSKLLNLILSATVILTVIIALPATLLAQAATAIDIGVFGGSNQTSLSDEHNWQYHDYYKSLTIAQSGGIYRLYGTNSALYATTGAPNINLILDNITMSNPAGFSLWFQYENVTVTLIGTNTVSCGASTSPLNFSGTSASSTITGNGTLIAMAGPNSSALSLDSQLYIINGSTLDLVGGPGKMSMMLYTNAEIYLDNTSTLKLTNNHATADESFTIAAIDPSATHKWKLTNATFSSGDPTNATVGITVAPGSTAVIQREPRTVPPGISGPTALSLVNGYPATSTGVYTLTGTPAPTVTKTSGNPAITWDNTNKKLNIAAGLPIGNYPVVLTAANGVTPNATLTFTLSVTGVAPGISGPTALSLVQGYTATSTAAYTLTGNPVPTITKTNGNSAITWDNVNKKLNISPGLAAGNYPVVLTATNGVSPNAALTFTLTVTPAPIPLTDKYTEAKIDFTAVANADYYQVQRSTNKTKGFKTIGTTLTTTFNDYHLVAGKAYYYRIRSVTIVNKKIVYGKFGKVIAFTTSKLPAVSGVLVTSDNKALKFKWTNTNNMSAIQIFYATTNSKKTKWKVMTVTDTEFALQNLTVNKKYFYKLRYVYFKGSTSYGNFSKVEEIVVK